MKQILTVLLTLVVCCKCVAIQQPNILFVIADDMSHTSAYGHKFVNTPHFDKLGKEGLRFTHMYTPSSKCSPSRAAILPSQPMATRRSCKPQQVARKFKSVVETLADNGYATGYTGKGGNLGFPKGRLLTGKNTIR